MPKPKLPSKITLTPSWDLIQPSLRLCITNAQDIILLSLLPTLLFDLGSILSHQTHAHNRVILGDICQVASLIWLLINVPALYIYQLAVIRGKRISLKAAYHQGLPLVVRFIGLSIIAGIGIIIGFILLIIPGIILINKWYLASYYLIDRRCSIKEALQASWRETKPYSGYIWGIFGVTILLAVASGVIQTLIVKPYGLGIILSTLVTYIYLFAPALRYQEIITATAAQSKRVKAIGKK
jgi:hypothetical protein